MSFLCPAKIECGGAAAQNSILGYDFPFANFSSEANDGPIFIGTNFGTIQAPPLDGVQPNNQCVVFSTSYVSQKYADTCSIIAQTQCADGTGPTTSFVSSTSPCGNVVGDSGGGGGGDSGGGGPGVPSNPGGCKPIKPGDCTKNGGQKFEPTPGGGGTAKLLCIDEEGSLDITVNSDFAPLSFNVSDGSVPQGMHLEITGDNTASITGTPTEAGHFAFDITAGVDPYFNTEQYVIDVFGIDNIDALPDAQAGAPYAFQLTAAGGTPPYTYGFDAFVGPDWFSVDSSGMCSGTPDATDAGQDEPVSVFVEDADGHICWNEGSIHVNCGVIDCSPKSLFGVKNAAFSQTLIGSGGVGPYTFNWTGGGSLPNGIGLASDGTLSGTPTNTGTSTFGVTVTDHSGCFNQVDITIVINDAGNAAQTAQLPCGGSGTFVTVTTPANTYTGPAGTEAAMNAQAMSDAVNAAAAQLAAGGCHCQISNETPGQLLTVDSTGGGCSLLYDVVGTGSPSWPIGILNLTGAVGYNYLGQRLLNGFPNNPGSRFDFYRTGDPHDAAHLQFTLYC